MVQNGQDDQFGRNDLQKKFWAIPNLVVSNLVLCKLYTETWDILGHLQASKRPLPGKLRRKSEKGLPGPLGAGVNMPPKKVENKSKTSQKPTKC